MKIEIKTTKANTAYNSHAFCADVKVNGKWFKQITSSETDKDKFELECLQITIDDLKQDSHSPTEPEFDTLQEGDWFQGTEKEYSKMLEILGLSNPGIQYYMPSVIKENVMGFDGEDIAWQFIERKTQLTPEEFLRRAENTFKTK